MVSRRWNKTRATSVRHAIELLIEHASKRRNLSVERIADAMGLPSHWIIYKWMESGKLPTIQIRNLETTCGAQYLTQYLATSAGSLLIPLPNGKTPATLDVNELQIACGQAVQHLIKFSQGDESADDTLNALTEAMEQLAWHRANVETHETPALDFGELNDE